MVLGDVFGGAGELTTVGEHPLPAQTHQVTLGYGQAVHLGLGEDHVAELKLPVVGDQFLHADGSVGGGLGHRG